MTGNFTEPHTADMNQSADQLEPINVETQIPIEQISETNTATSVKESLYRKCLGLFKRKRQSLRRWAFRLILLFLLFYGLWKVFAIVLHVSFEWQVLTTIMMVVVCLILLLWKLPKWQVSSIKSVTPDVAFNLENEARKTLAQILAGIIVFVGFYGTWKSMQVSEESQVTERFNKAIDQLGSDKIQTRLGAIYALERLAQDSRRDHNSIMEILAAFVRENTSNEAIETEETETPVVVSIESHEWRNATDDLMKSKKLRNANQSQEEGVNPAQTQKPSKRGMQADVLAILGIFRRRAKPDNDISYVPIDLRNTMLEGTFLAGAHLNKAIFWQAQLKYTSFEQATLEQANFFDANLTGADFRDANLKGALFDYARLDAAKFKGAELEGADLSAARGLTLEQVKEAKNYDKAKLPETISETIRKRPIK